MRHKSMYYNRPVCGADHYVYSWSYNRTQWIDTAELHIAKNYVPSVANPGAQKARYNRKRVMIAEGL